TFSILDALRATLGADLTPRVLVYLPHQDDLKLVRSPELGAADQEDVDRIAFVEASLGGADLISKLTSDRREFEREVRSGAWNTYVIMGKDPGLADELREAVFRGDGLVLVEWQGASTKELEEALGARVQGSLSG